jgi:hypothetical protein
LDREREIRVNFQKGNAYETMLQKPKVNIGESKTTVTAHIDVDPVTVVDLLPRGSTDARCTYSFSGYPTINPAYLKTALSAKHR